MSYKIQCTNCGARQYSDELKMAPHPFISGEQLLGCSECGEIEDLERACDEQGCWNRVSCGTPTESGYRNTCSVHKPEHKPTHA